MARFIRITVAFCFMLLISSVAHSRVHSATQAPPSRFERAFSIPILVITWALPWHRFPF